MSTELLTSNDYTVRILSRSGDVGADGAAILSVLYSEGLDSDTAKWTRNDTKAVESKLSDTFGGKWRVGGWDAGDHPTQLEQIATARRV